MRSLACHFWGFRIDCPGGDVWFARCELRSIPRVLAEWQAGPEFGNLREGDHRPGWRNEWIQ